MPRQFIVYHAYSYAIYINAECKNSQTKSTKKAVIFRTDTVEWLIYDFFFAASRQMMSVMIIL